MASDENIKYRRSPEVVCVEQPGGVLALMIGGERDYFYVVDGCAAECYQMLDGELTVGEIAEDVARNNGIDTELILRDFKILIQQLKSENLLEQ